MNCCEKWVSRDVDTACDSRCACRPYCSRTMDASMPPPDRKLWLHKFWPITPITLVIANPQCYGGPSFWSLRFLTTPSRAPPGICMRHYNKHIFRMFCGLLRILLVTIKRSPFIRWSLEFWLSIFIVFAYFLAVWVVVMWCLITYLSWHFKWL